MTTILNTCKSSSPNDSWMYEISTTDEDNIVIKPTNKHFSSGWTEKGLDSSILIDKNSVVDKVVIYLGRRKISLDYSEIQDLMMAIKVYNKSRNEEYVLSEVREY